jgi:uncharacterized protein with GYD domain
MPLYIMFSKLTVWGRKTIKERPERIKEVNKEVEAMGAKIKAQYATLGMFDFINVLEAPDNETIARVAVELGARGTLETTTVGALTLDDFISELHSKKK